MCGTQIISAYRDMEGAQTVSGHLAQECELGLDIQRAYNAHRLLVKLVTLL